MTKVGLPKISYFMIITIVLWVTLSTVIPNLYKNYKFPLNYENIDGYSETAYYNDLNSPNIIKNNLTNSHFVLFTAHPDDESMFFTPVITELTKSNYNNHFHLICLSNGDFNGLGNIRQREIEKAAKLLNIDTIKVLDYVDDIKTYWNKSDIINTFQLEINEIQKKYKIDNENLIILTFDEEGVSNHPNHKSLYIAVEEFNKLTNIRSYSLKSWNLLTKYSGVFFTNIELALIHLSKWDSLLMQLDHYNIDLFKYFSKEESKNIMIYSDLNSVFLNLTTMTWAHYSQIVWFRWIWIFFSKYMNSNELVLISA